MKMTRKTIEVEYMKTFANVMLAGTSPLMKEARLGAAMMLEEILFQTSNYKGYRLLEPNGDESRRHYL